MQIQSVIFEYQTHIPGIAVDPSSAAAASSSVSPSPAARQFCSSNDFAIYTLQMLLGARRTTKSGSVVYVTYPGSVVIIRPDPHTHTHTPSP